MLRHGCEDQDCAYCPRGQKRPTVYAAKAFAQQYIMVNRRICPRIAALFVPLINFSRPHGPESLIMRVRCGKIPDEMETPVSKPNIGINVRPQHVHKHKQKVKEPIKEKPIENVGQFKLKKLTGPCMEKVHPFPPAKTTANRQVVEITNDTKDDSFLRQILDSLSDVAVLSESFCEDRPRRLHKNVITDQASILTMFQQLDRRHMPLLFDSLHRALLETQTTAVGVNKELHCIHLSWQALASTDNSLEIGGLPLAVTLVEIGSRTTDFKSRFEAFAVFLSNYEWLCAKPVIRIIQSLLVLDWNGEYIVEGFREKCLILLTNLYKRYSSNEYLGPLFHNETITKTALSERFQRSFAWAFASKEHNTLLDYPFLFSHSDKISLFEFWVISEMERQHYHGWSLRRLARYFYNLGFHVDEPQSAYFGITAERQDILHDVTKAITKQSISVLRRPMKVRYAGEQGIDLAGLTSDLLAKVIKASIARCLDINILRESRTVWFQEGADGEGEFKRLGVLIGLAMYNGVKSLPLDFPPMFYKKLVGEPLELEDMKEFDPDLLRGWKLLLECDQVDDLMFEYVYQLGGEIHTHILDIEPDKPPINTGTKRPQVNEQSTDTKVDTTPKHPPEPKVVTLENRQQYIQALFDAVTDKLIAQSFNSLQEGLESIIPRRVLRFFTSSQLQSLMAGERVVDVGNAVELLKQVTVYEGYSPNHPLIQSLWTLLSNGTPLQFSRFLDLTTASDRLPVSFPAKFKLTIFRSGTDQEM
jgi:hypothetical protein